MTLPNFIGIGPGKTGTTWLHRALAQHPEVRLARHIKETDFFTHNYRRGLPWYENFFAGYEGIPAIGEISDSYFGAPKAPARIAQDVPDAKLITVLRNPIERVVSVYLFHYRNGMLKGTIEEAIAGDPDFLGTCFYDAHLARYYAQFPAERIFVGLFDELENNPADFLRRVFAFLRVDPQFVPANANKTVLPASAPRHPRLFRQLHRVARWLRRNEYHRALRLAKSNPLLMGALTRPVPDDARPILSPDTHARLRDAFAPHIEKTATLIGRDLSRWM